jgi:protein-tyrosine phosphatase
MFNGTTRQHQKYGTYFLLLAMLIIPYGQMLGSLYYAAYPSLTCLLVSWAYLYNDHDFLAKDSRAYPWLTRVFYGPYLFITWCTWRYYKNSITPWTEIAPDILLGRRLDKKEIKELIDTGSLSILDLAPEIKEPVLPSEVRYLHIPIIDLTPPSLKQLINAVSYIERMLAHGRVFIHCKLGLSRSAVITAAFLIKRGKNLHEALSLICRLRPEVLVTKEMITILDQYQQWISGASSNLYYET